MNDIQKKQPTPPYMSLPQLEKLIELVSTRNIPIITTSLFRGYGFNDFDATVSVGALRFLYLIDESGKPTASMSKLRLKGDARKKAFEEIVRKAYEKLFTVVDAPHELSLDDLNNEMVVQYDLTPRVVRSAVPAFRKLCEYAGLLEEGATSVRKAPVRSDKQRQVPKSLKASPKARQQTHKEPAPEALNDGDTHIQPIVKGKMSISIPEDVFLRAAIDDDLNDAWRAVLKAAHKFAADYLEEVKPSAGEAVSTDE
jgi:hypothetical protein